MRRLLKIKNYRNLGTNIENASNDNEFELLLNADYEKEQGGLVILLGHNNVGKSNIISALKSLRLNGNNDGDLSKKDITYHDNSKDHLPLISLQTISSHNKNPSDYSVSLRTKNGTPEYKLVLEQMCSKDPLTDEEDSFIKHLISYFKESSTSTKNNFLAILRKDSKLVKLLNNYYEHKSDINYLNFDLVKGLYDILLNNTSPTITNIQSLKSYLNDHNVLLTSIESKYSTSGWDIFYNKYKCNPVSKIVSYSLPVDIDKSHSFKKEDFELKINDYTLPSVLNKLFANLFKIINYDYSDLADCYEKAKENSDRLSLNEKADQINKMIETTIGEDFNKFFSTYGGDKYSLKVIVDDNLLSFGLEKNGESFTIEQASDGFRWMFDFYFTFYANNMDLNPGDIILMDDPCVYLHDSCIVEFRNYLRNFAEEKHVTIVVATHRPSFVDVDHLEEIRVIKNEQNSARSYSFFAAGNTEIRETRDALRYIVEGLSTSRNVLIDDVDNNIVFVEGSTDYYYLTGYKNYLKCHDLDYGNLTFLPLGGVKSGDDIVSKVKLIDKIPFFLVDDDGNVKKKIGGKAFIKENKNDKSIILKCLTDIDPKFHSIEDLFTNDEKKDNGLIKKEFANAVSMKKKIQDGSIETQTQDNFEKVFDFLKNLFNSYTITINENGKSNTTSAKKVKIKK